MLSGSGFPSVTPVPAAPDRVVIWVFPLRARPVRIRALADLLDSRERARWARLRDAEARDWFAVAHGAARIILAGYLNVPAHSLRWHTGRWGKPELEGVPGAPRVSLSHSGGMALLAAARRAVGVDIERIRDRWRSRPPAQFFPAPEIAAIAAADDRAALFGQLLTRKEACVKAVGGRLLPDGVRLSTYPPPPLSVTGFGTSFQVQDVPVPTGYAAAVALTGLDGFDVEVRDPSLEGGLPDTGLV